MRRCSKLEPLPSCTCTRLLPTLMLSCAVLSSPEQPGFDLYHLRGRTECVLGECYWEPPDVYHPHHRGSSGG